MEKRPGFHGGFKNVLCDRSRRATDSASFKVEEDQFEELAATTYFRPAPYFAKHHWVMIEDIAKAKISNWKEFIETSYRLVFDKLSAKKKAEIVR